jgi:hypothetical protein
MIRSRSGKELLRRPELISREVISAFRFDGPAAARPGSAGLSDHPHRLLEEERVSARHLERRSTGTWIPAGTSSAISITLSLLLRASSSSARRLRSETKRGDPSPRLGPRRSEDEQRGQGGALADEGQQLEQRRLGPVQILDHDCGRTLLGAQLE